MRTWGLQSGRVCVAARLDNRRALIAPTEITSVDLISGTRI